MSIQVIKARNLDQAQELKETHGDRAVFLAGGTFINSREWDKEFDLVIMLEDVLAREVIAGKDWLEIGAFCHFQGLMQSPLVPDILKQACALISSRNVRNRVTIGGHVASKNPTGALLVPLLVMNAEVVLANSNKLSLVDYLASESTDLITGIRIPRTGLTCFFGLTHFKRSANDRAILVAAASIQSLNGMLSDVRLAIGGVHRFPVRLSKIEDLLINKTPPKKNWLEETVSHEVHPSSGIQCSAEFKKYLAGALVNQALEQSMSQAEDLK